MITLYTKPLCPFCLRVLAANESIGAPLTIADITTDEAAKARLLELGGKQQTPFLEDTDRGVLMYESADIIAYLSNTYGDGLAVTLPDSPNICPIE